MQSVSSNAVAESKSYSTTETLTGGTWIDGKPIYRKVLQGTLTGSEQAVNHHISNLGTVIRQYGFLSGNNFTPVGFSFSNYYFSTYTDSSKVNIRASSSYVNETFGIILEYTKTTD